MKPMPSKVQKEAVNILFCGFLMILSFFLLGDLSKVQMSPFDYLASSAVPTVLCWALITLASFVLVRSVLALFKVGQTTLTETPVDELESGSMSTTFQLLWIGAISIVYVVTINFSLVPYAVSTTLMLASCMAILAPKGKRNWWLILGISVSVGGGCAYVFTEILPLPFPGF